MVKVSETTFDGGSSGGNSLMTARTTYVEDSTTDQRVTSFQHDVRGRTIVTENPQAPHSLVKYDNLGRMVASATYSTRRRSSRTTTAWSARAGAPMTTRSDTPTR
jgi:hypothetical protein